MRKEKVNELVAKLAAARAELVAATAEQSEEIDGYTVNWALMSTGRVMLLVGAANVSGPAILQSAPDEVIDRFREVRAALAAWERNEGDWPLAKPAEKDKDKAKAEASL